MIFFFEIRKVLMTSLTVIESEFCKNAQDKKRIIMMILCFTKKVIHIRFSNFKWMYFNAQFDLNSWNAVL